MNVTLEKIGATEGKIIVSVEENDYKAKVDNKLKEIGRTHSIPGFRKGHVPAGYLAKNFGKQVKSDVLNNEVYEAVINYIRDNKIAILGEPLPVSVKEISLDDKDYTFEYEIGFAPEIDVKIDKDVKIPYYVINVTDEMKADQSRMLRQRFGTQEPSEHYEDRALVKGVLMQLDENGNVSEAPGAIQVTGGIVAPFLFKSKEEAAKFEGKSVGDKVVFNPWNTCEGNAAELASMLNVDKNIAVDVKSDFEMAISEIIVNREAELNQEFFDEVFGKDKVKSEEEYNKSIEAMVASQLAPNSENLFHIQAEKTIVDRFGKFELPTEFLKKWLVARNEGLTEENIDAEYAKMEPSVKWQLLKERIAKQADIKIEEEDVLGFAKSIAAQQLAQYGMYNLGDEVVTDYAKRIIADKNSRSRIVEEVGDRKLFNAIRALADIEVKNVSLDEFKKVAEEAQA